MFLDASKSKERVLHHDWCVQKQTQTWTMLQRTTRSLMLVSL